MPGSIEIVEIANLRAEARALREQLADNQTRLPEMMTAAEAAAAIQQAVSAAHAAYWAACDAEGRAVDPADLEAPENFLDDAYDAALQVESLAAARGISWGDARDLV